MGRSMPSLATIIVWLASPAVAPRESTLATGFSAGQVFVPRLTRLVAATFTAVAFADVLQLGYAAAQQLPKRAAG